MRNPRVIRKRLDVPSINTIAEVWERLDNANIRALQHRCTRVRNRNVHCTRCINACVSGCISVEGNSLSIEPGKCIGCGSCTTACPVSALICIDPDDDTLREASLAVSNATGGVVTIACEKMMEAAADLVDSTKVVSVKCLGRVDESLILDMAAAGVSELWMVRAECGSCDRVHGGKLAKRVRKSAQALLDTWHSGLMVHIVPRFPNEARIGDRGGYLSASGESRRAFFTDIKEGAVNVAATTANYAAEQTLGLDGGQDGFDISMLRVGESHTLPQFMPSRRVRVLEDLAALGEPDDDLVKTRLFGHVIIDTEKCNGCTLCATFCPTGAIERIDEEEGFGVDFHPSRCLRCRTCLGICYRGAIEISEEVFASDLASGAHERYLMTRQEGTRLIK